MAAIIYKRNKFYYSPECIDLSTAETLSRDEAQEVLFFVKEQFDSINLNIYLMFGTLLGAVREGDFIKNDYDVDVYIENEGLLFSNLGFLEENGLKLVRAISGKLYTFRYNGAKKSYIDIAILKTPINIWGFYCYSIEGFYIPKKLFKPGEIYFLGKIFNCPAEPEKMLEYLYGKTWRIPLTKSEKDYYYDVPSYHFYKNNILQPLKNVIKSILKFIMGGKYIKYRNRYRNYEA